MDVNEVGQGTVESGAGAAGAGAGASESSAGSATGSSSTTGTAGSAAGSGGAATGSATGNATGSSSTGTEIQQPGTEGQVAEPNEFAALEGLFGGLSEEVPAAGNEGQQQTQGMPEEVSRLVQTSEYVKDAAQLENAVRAAEQLWDVSAGKVPAHSLLDGIRTTNPQQFETVMRESIIPYVEMVTGMKLGAQAAAADPVAEMRAELEQLKQRPQIEAQQRQAQERVQRAESASRTAVEAFIKSGSGIFEGATDDALNALALQLPKLGINPQAMMQQVLEGRTELLEKAYKSAEKAEMLRVKARTDRLIARAKALKSAVPASKGNAAESIDSQEPPPGATREQLVAYMKTGKWTTAVN